MIGSLAIMVLTMIFSFDAIFKQRGTLVFYKSMIQFLFYLVPPLRITPWYLDDNVALHHPL